MNDASKILIIDDEASIRLLLRLNLEARGYVLEEAGNAADGLDKAMKTQPHLVLLDLGLPDGRGLDVLKSLRAWTTVPILVLTVDDSDVSKVALLEAGADDYVTKPFSFIVLAARIQVALRHRLNEGATPLFVSDDLQVDLAKRLIWLDGAPVHLTATEFEILKWLTLSAGRVVSQEFLLKEIWGKHALGNNHYLRIYMGQLRKKLERDPSAPKHLITEPGVGYRLL